MFKGYNLAPNQCPETQQSLSKEKTPLYEGVDLQTSGGLPGAAASRCVAD